MRVANSNDELMITGNIREGQAYRCKMKDLFAEGDSSRDGMMTKDECMKLLSDERVRAWFRAVGLDPKDPEHMWDLLESGDLELDASEEIDQNRFLNTVARLRGNATRVDVVTLQRSVI